MNGPGGFDSTDRGIPSEGDAYKVVQTDNALVPVTIRQILQNPLTPGQTPEIDGKPRKIVSIVGMIVDIEEVNISVHYQVDDGTGVFRVTDYTQQESNLAISFDKYTYVYVVGRLTSGSQDNSSPPCITAFAIKQVTDPNQIAFHNLQALFVHLFTTRGLPANSEFNNHAAENANQTDQSNSDSKSCAAPAISKEQEIQNAVLNFLKRRAQSEYGIHINEIAQAFPHYSVEAIQQACYQLSFNGEIFNTSEADHYSVC